MVERIDHGESISLLAASSSPCVRLSPSILTSIRSTRSRRPHLPANTLPPSSTQVQYPYARGWTRYRFAHPATAALPGNPSRQGRPPTPDGCPSEGGEGAAPLDPTPRRRQGGIILSDLHTRGSYQSAVQTSALPTPLLALAWLRGSSLSQQHVQNRRSRDATAQNQGWSDAGAALGWHA